MKKWMLKRNKVNIEKMAEVLGVSKSMATVMANRGIGTPKTAEKFLKCHLESMYDGKFFKDMEKGILFLAEAINQNKKIAIYGDYDVDGVMSTVILYKTLKTFSDNVIFHIPHRQKEGYGLNMDSLYELEKQGVQVILTCDNGIAAIEESKVLAQLNIDLVILDHHEPAFVEEDGKRADIVPLAVAVIDHKQKDCAYPFKHLCAGGMAYKFAGLFFEQMKTPFHISKELIVFSAIATICDIVDLMDENRTIVKNGLMLLPKTPNIGLQTLIEETELDINAISEFHIGFVIGPCINATGRLESAREAVELFTTDSKIRAKELAEDLVSLNAQRKLMTQEATEEIIEAIENSDLKEDKVLVVYNDRIHESIAGIVAGRIKEKYYRPTIVLTKGEEMAKGSARSIESYNIFEELFKQKHLFHKFGGHPMAAGLSLPQENISKLRQALNTQCVLLNEDLVPEIRIEKQLSFAEVNLDLVKELETLSPFGKANPSPIFGSKNIYIEKTMAIGKNKNILKFSLRDTVSGLRIDGISFDGYDDFIDQCTSKFGQEGVAEILSGRKGFYMDILYALVSNTFGGRTTVQLNLKDFRIN